MKRWAIFFVALFYSVALAEVQIDLAEPLVVVDAEGKIVGRVEVPGTWPVITMKIKDDKSSEWFYIRAKVGRTGFAFNDSKDYGSRIMFPKPNCEGEPVAILDGEYSIQHGHPTAVTGSVFRVSEVDIFGNLWVALDVMPLKYTRDMFDPFIYCSYLRNDEGCGTAGWCEPLAGVQTISFYEARKVVNLYDMFLPPFTVRPAPQPKQ